MPVAHWGAQWSPFEHRDDVQNAVQHARSEELPDADHIVPMTDPGAVAAVIAAFLRSQPAG